MAEREAFVTDKIAHNVGESIFQCKLFDWDQKKSEDYIDIRYEAANWTNLENMKSPK